MKRLIPFVLRVGMCLQFRNGIYLLAKLENMMTLQLQKESKQQYTGTTNIAVVTERMIAGSAFFLEDSKILKLTKKCMNPLFFWHQQCIIKHLFMVFS